MWSCWRAWCLNVLHLCPESGLYQLNSVLLIKSRGRSSVSLLKGKKAKILFLFSLLIFSFPSLFFPSISSFFPFPFLPFFSFLHEHHPLETISALCSRVEKRGEKEKKSKPIYNKANKKSQYFIEKGLRHPLIPISSLSFAVAVKKDLPASKLMLPEGFPSVFRLREVLDPAHVKLLLSSYFCSWGQVEVDFLFLFSLSGYVQYLTLSSGFH